MDNNNNIKVALRNQEGQSFSTVKFGCSWGKLATSTKITVVDDNGFFGIGRKTHREYQKLDVDLDLSCVIIDKNGDMCDHIYSPKFKQELLNQYNLPLGKYHSQNGSIHHSGDNLKGKDTPVDDTDSEVITIDLSKLDDKVAEIVFFLNDSGRGELSKLPFVRIHLDEVSQNTPLWEVDAAKLPQCKNNNTFIIGKIVRTSNGWSFLPIGYSFTDENICITIERILNSYIK